MTTIHRYADTDQPDPSQKGISAAPPCLAKNTTSHGRFCIIASTSSDNTPPLDRYTPIQQESKDTTLQFLLETHSIQCATSLNEVALSVLKTNKGHYPAYYSENNTYVLQQYHPTIQTHVQRPGAIAAATMLILDNNRCPNPEKLLQLPPHGGHRVMAHVFKNANLEIIRTHITGLTGNHRIQHLSDLISENGPAIIFTSTKRPFSPQKIENVCIIDKIDAQKGLVRFRDPELGRELIAPILTITEQWLTKKKVIQARPQSLSSYKLTSRVIRSIPQLIVGSELSYEEEETTIEYSDAEIETASPSTLEELISLCEESFISDFCEEFYDEYCHLSLAPEIFQKTIESCRQAYASIALQYNAEKHIGFIQRIDVEPGTQIFARADLHGDLGSLIKNLSALQEQGLLDENFRIPENKRGRFKMVFLGDYIDRGPNSLEVLMLLCMLKNENGDDVILLRGNHEHNGYSLESNPDCNEYLTARENKFIADNKLKQGLLRFFEYLPLAVYIGCRDSSSGDYIQFSHGLFDLHRDISDILVNNTKIMYLNKLTDDEMSNISLGQRIAAMIPKKFIAPQIDVLNQFIAAPSDTTAHILKIFFDLPTRSSNAELRRKIKLCIAAHNVDEYIRTNRAFIERCERCAVYGYLWGDMSELPQKPLYRGIVIDPELAQHYFTIMSVMSGGIYTIKSSIRGHQHRPMLYKAARKDGIVHTLSAGGELLPYDKKDVTYLLSAAKKGREWTMQRFSRDKGAERTSLSEKMPLYSRTERTLDPATER